MPRIEVCEICYRESTTAICAGCDQMLEDGWSIEAVREMDKEESQYQAELARSN